MASKKIRTGILAGCGVAAAAFSVSQAKAATTLYDSGSYTSATVGSTLVSNGYGQGPIAGTDTAGTSGTISAGGDGHVANVTAGGAGLAYQAQQFYLPTLVATPAPTDSGVSIQFDLSSTASSVNYSGLGLQVFNNGATSNPLTLALFEAVSTTQAPAVLTIDNGVTGNLNSTSGTVGTTDHYDIELNYYGGTYTIAEGTGPGASIIASGNFNTTGGFYDVGLTVEGLDTLGGAQGTGLFDNLTVTAVPEPTTASLVVGGLAVAGLRRRRRSTAK